MVLLKMLFLYNIYFRPILIKIFINIAFNESNFHLKMIKMDKILVAVNKLIFQFGLHLGGRWSQLTGGRCSEVVLVLKLLGQDLGLSLLRGGRYSEVVVSTGLTVLDF